MQIGKRSASIVAVAGAALSLSLALASDTAAAYKTGKYAGTTAQGEEIHFRAKKMAVKKFDLRVYVGCDDGSRQAIDASRGKAPVKRKGKFTATFLGKGFTLRVKGRLKRKTGQGKIDTVGAAPSGASCAGSVDWMAKRKPPARNRAAPS